MDRTTWQMAPDVAAEGKRIRTRYVDAIRDWVAKGDASQYALSPEEARKRMRGQTNNDALAAANFRLGQYLFSQGHQQDARRYFLRGETVTPGEWNFIRQELELQGVGNASGPEFWTQVDALGEKAYYPQANSNVRLYRYVLREPRDEYRLLDPSRSSVEMNVAVSLTNPDFLRPSVKIERSFLFDLVIRITK